MAYMSSTQESSRLFQYESAELCLSSAICLHLCIAATNTLGSVKLREGLLLTALAWSDILYQYGTEQEMSQTGDGRSGNIQQENNSTLLKCLMDRFEENNFVIRLDFGSIIY